MKNIDLDRKWELNLPVELRFNFLWEGINALHPIFEPAEHGELLSWIDKIKATIPPKLLEENSRLRENAPFWFEALSYEALSDEHWEKPWTEVIKCWAQTPPDVFILRCLAGIANDEVLHPWKKKINFQQVVQYLGSWFSQGEIPLLKKALIKPEEWLARILSLLEEILPFLETEYQELALPKLNAFSENMRQIIADNSLQKIFATISPRLKLNPESGILEISAWGIFIDLKNYLKLIIAPTYFLGHRYAATHQKSLILCQGPELNVPEIPAELPIETINKIKALTNETNLSILKHLGRRNLCTMELAELLGIARPFVTKHLNELRAYRLVKECFRVKNRIFFRVDYVEMRQAWEQLFDFLKH